MTSSKMPKGFTRCDVCRESTTWLVTFRINQYKTRSFLIQTDFDQAAFAVACGKIQAPPDWDGCPSKLPDPQVFYYFDPSEIEFCPREYFDMAQED